MRYVAISFADKTFQSTASRYVNELLSKKLFYDVICFTERDFELDFINNHFEFIKQNPKGYGYYIWKPYFILKALKGLEDGDILVYGDAGNDMPGTKEECEEKFKKVMDVKKGIRILASKQGWSIRWIKSDLYFSMGWVSVFYSLRRMVEAGRLVIQKNSQTVKFVEEWLYYSTIDYHNIDNSPSRLPNLPFFIEHRNDQSIFTILFHKYAGTIMDFGEVWRAKRIRQ